MMGSEGMQSSNNRMHTQYTTKSQTQANESPKMSTARPSVVKESPKSQRPKKIDMSDQLNKM